MVTTLIKLVTKYVLHYDFYYLIFWVEHQYNIYKFVKFEIHLIEFDFETSNRVVTDKIA